MDAGTWTDRLPDNWRRMLSTRAAITLTILVALLSVATGLYNISQEIIEFGPVAAHVPNAVQRAVGFTGVLTGFLMVGSAFALRRGLRVGWWSTLFLLPITAGQGLLQGSPYSLPLVVLSLVAIPTLLVTRNSFTGTVSLTATQLGAGGALVGVQLYGTVGAYTLREDFDGIETLIDAFYFTLITSSTVGYGDIHPGSEEAQLFTMSVVVLGVASFGIAIGALVGPAIQARLTKTLGKMTDSQLQTLENHVLVLGYGELTEPIVDVLEAGGTPFAVVTRDQEATTALADRDIPVVSADPSDEGPLERAHIERARAILVATNDDAQDALAILTARQLRPDGRIVAAATDRENTKKLERAGADEVISPAQLGGHLLVRSALEGGGSRLVERIMGGE
ncbi:NAD-binding protein [Halovivax sp.]|uniref:NAD-binding protein n=1 Tax=Halovivax sp. TaxID=1935978 RepID=UPI0025B9F0AA|nr:NAD-binding protein [Halovivax sp.]